MPIVLHLSILSSIIETLYLTAVCNASCAIPRHALSRKKRGERMSVLDRQQTIADSLLVSRFTFIGLSFPIADDRVFHVVAFGGWQLLSLSL